MKSHDREYSLLDLKTQTELTLVSNVNQLRDKLTGGMNILRPATNQLTSFGNFQVYLQPRLEKTSPIFNQIMYFGTFEYMRAELEVIHKAE